MFHYCIYVNIDFRHMLSYLSLSEGFQKQIVGYSPYSCYEI